MNLDVRFVNKNSEEMWQVRELYDKTFNDTKEYTDFLFGEIVPDRDTEIIAGFIDEKLISMMFLRKKKLLSGGQRISSCLIYGVATAEEYRRRGYMSQLMECALSYCGTVGILFIYLIPVNPKVYEGMGFIPAREEKRIPLMDIECENDKYIIEKAHLDEENSPYSEYMSFFSIMVEGVNKGITTEKDEHYFMRKLEQAQVENAGIYVIRDKDMPGGTEDIEAIVITGASDDDGRIYVTDIICAGEWENSYKYGKLVVDSEAGIMPFIKLNPIMIYNWTSLDLCIKLNEDV